MEEKSFLVEELEEKAKEIKPVPEELRQKLLRFVDKSQMIRKYLESKDEKDLIPGKLRIFFADLLNPIGNPFDIFPFIFGTPVDALQEILNVSEIDEGRKKAILDFRNDFMYLGSKLLRYHAEEEGNFNTLISFNYRQFVNLRNKIPYVTANMYTFDDLMLSTTQEVVNFSQLSLATIRIVRDIYDQIAGAKIELHGANFSLQKNIAKEILKEANLLAKTLGLDIKE